MQPNVSSNRSSTAWGLASVVLFLALVSPARSDDSDVGRRFLDHVKYLADDKLTGRGVGSEGIDKAAEYIAAQFKEIGLAPAGDNGTFFQTFPLTLHRTLTDASKLAVSGDQVERKQGADYIPFNFSSDDAFSGSLAFCGYAIVNPDKAYDDFAGLDVKGAVVLVFDGEPRSWADEKGEPTRHAMIRNKVYNAKDRGAVAVLVVSPSPLPDAGEVLTEFVAEGADQYGIPAFHVTRAFAESTIQAGRFGSLDELQAKLDAGKPASGFVAHVAVNGQAGFDKKTAPVRNVLGVLHGEGALADQFVIVGAHYDHLGVRKPMMRKFKAGKVVADDAGPQIHNGADDNASGTSGVIEIARALAAGPRPKRSILFIAFTAEESGLHGSKYFVEHPFAPLEKTTAMLNLDMVGRMNESEKTVQVFGTECGEGFSELVSSAAGKVGLKIAPGVDYGGRSDHAPFLRKNVPAMHFYTGAHNDYHKPTDDADKINADGGARVVKTVVDAARQLADRAEATKFIAAKAEPKKEEAAGSAPTYRVVMGLTPGYGDDGKPGMAVDAVSPEGPADMAGMKGGDRIIRIGDKKIANVYDYMAGTRNNKAGDLVEVAVLRDGTEHVLKVALAPAK